MASDFYCGDCGDPVEPHQSRPYGRNVKGLSVHVGENYLMNQRYSGLDPEDHEQLRRWAHPVKVVNGKGEPMDLNVGQQFRRRY